MLSLMLRDNSPRATHSPWPKVILTTGILNIALMSCSQFAATTVLSATITMTFSPSSLSMPAGWRIAIELDRYGLGNYVCWHGHDLIAVSSVFLHCKSVVFCDCVTHGLRLRCRRLLLIYSSVLVIATDRGERRLHLMMHRIIRLMD